MHGKEPGERDYLVYTHASCIGDSTLWPDTCNDFLSYISGPCEDLFELQDDIAHTEAQDSLMCLCAFACYQQMILYYKTQCFCIES